MSLKGKQKATKLMDMQVFHGDLTEIICSILVFRHYCVF